MNYQNTFLKRVLVRLDYPTLSALSSPEKPNFSNLIFERFPNRSSEKKDQITISSSPTGSAIDRKPLGWEWKHRSAEGEKLVTLAPDFLALEYGAGQYTAFAPFRDDLEFVFNALRGEFGVQNFSRLGLRFINEINFADGDPLDWDNLVDESLVSSVKASLTDDMQLTRSMHQLAAKCGDEIILLMNYGILNPDYPNQVVRRQFVIDLDFYTQGAIESNEVIRLVNEMNALAERTFEESIEQGLRDKMGVIDE